MGDIRPKQVVSETTEASLASYLGWVTAIVKLLPP